MSLSNVKRNFSQVPQDEQRTSAHADLGAQEGSHAGSDESSVHVETDDDKDFMLFGDMELQSPSARKTKVSPVRANKETISIEALTSGMPLEDSLQFAALTEEKPPPKPSSTKRRRRRRPRADVPDMDAIVAAGAAHAAAAAQVEEEAEAKARAKEKAKARKAAAALKKAESARRRAERASARSSKQTKKQGSQSPKASSPKKTRARKPKPPPGPRTAREEAEAILGDTPRRPGGPLRAEDLEDPGEERTESTEGTLWWWPVVQKSSDDHEEKSGPMHVLRSSNRPRQEPLRSIVPDEIMPETRVDQLSTETSRTATVLLAACAVVGVVALLWSLT